MLSKRSRASYESDLNARPDAATFVTYGTPLPQDANVADDGSYIPIHKQEALDERGRKRFHGAFTGGWSAGYYNTVGSKEGWTPSDFVSSRTHRSKKDENPSQSRPEDFMDQEDLADLQDAQQLRTREEFAGFGSVAGGHQLSGGLADLFQPRGETRGFRLLRKMGWKDGQGIGPRVLRKARVMDSAPPSSHAEAARTYLFAPDDIAIISSVRKTDRRGLGFCADGLESRQGPPIGRRLGNEENGSDDGENLGTTRRGGIGFGVLNDSGSDEEDPYEVGPKIKYNKAVVLKKAKKTKKESSNPLARPGSKLKSILVATARKKVGPLLTRGGVPQLDGFVLSGGLLSAATGGSRYPVPCIPPSWSPSRPDRHAISKPAASQVPSAAGSIPHDPRSRAKVLGEAPLPGKSVFDFMSASARERLVAATGKHNLPPARGETAIVSEFPAKASAGNPPKGVSRPDKGAAAAALERDRSGRSPYASNAVKRSRYRQYLEYHAGISSALLPPPDSMSEKDFLMELEEFHNCVGIFKPMTGFMASRFTTSSSPHASNEMSSPHNATTKPTTSIADAAAEAARLGMFGPITRSITNFCPTRLLCKRFNVAMPVHVVANDVLDEPQPSALPVANQMLNTNSKSQDGVGGTVVSASVDSVLVGHSFGQSRPPDYVFREIFGDSTDEEVI